MNINIEIIENHQHRKGISGADWYFVNGNLQVRVSKMSDWRREIVLGIHEAIEAIVCKQNGVSVEAVDAFDAEYERTHAIDLDAGDDPLAPYHREHTLATAVERMLCYALGVQWKEYDSELAAIPSRQNQ